MREQLLSRLLCDVVKLVSRVVSEVDVVQLLLGHAVIVQVVITGGCF